MTRYLTKSRFKLGLECPNKLFYTRKEEYPNTKSSDSFLLALAQGGFQVEELARMHYPDGVLIEGNDWDYELVWKQTLELLEQKNVIIYEAAFLIDNLFVRTDILVKRGDEIELIEVKSKAFDPDNEYHFIGKKGGIHSNRKSNLFDVAFQKHVIQMCFPEWKIKSYMMMADKSKKASINGLNQLFRISRKEEGRTGIVKKVDSLVETGNSVLGRKEVTQIISDIEADKFTYHQNFGFKDAIKLFKEKYINDEYANWPASFGACKNCEFKCSKEELNDGKKSGFRECYSKQFKWVDNDFDKPNIFDIYDFRKGSGLFDMGVLFKSDLTEESIGLKIEGDKLTTSHRQWIQIEKDVSNDTSIYVDKEGLKQELDSWTFPLHFIDFETSTVALPFTIGRSPYEQVVFQFSHHIYNEDGSVDHASEYINNHAGEFPNFEFLRALKKSLGNDIGSIMRFSNFENSILNAIYIQLQNSKEVDKEELMTFIQGISHSTKGSTITWKGKRDMVDLWGIEKSYYYNPLTKGSNSIKDVLPAALASSAFLQEKYVRPIGKIQVSSRNFPDDHTWLNIESGNVQSPYNMLPRLFQDWNEEQIENTLSEMDGINEGGAAMTAYGKLQYTDMGQDEIDELTSALLQYCELDTLAMVMIYEHFRELIDQ